ncbi:MAG: hypothetical protein HS108_13515 [Planctomycetes bacterium]|jgi:hypothetical protein|nr:hypothetical protein [Planctomycetota bacterium]MCL4730167.1 hypothetical protein [Planctomycetota bacterium]
MDRRDIKLAALMTLLVCGIVAALWVAWGKPNRRHRQSLECRVLTKPEQKPARARAETRQDRPEAPLPAPVVQEPATPVSTLPAPAAAAPTEERHVLVLDFVRKDLQTVVHYIGLRTGLNVVVEGTIAAEITTIQRRVLPKDVSDEDLRLAGLEMLEPICKANDLELVRDGQFVIIKQRRR